MVLVCFQHLLRFRLSLKQLGRMKAPGFSVDDARAWILTQRAPFQLRLANAKAACYIGPASPKHGLSASKWSRLLQKGPGKNRKEALKLFDRDILRDSSLMAYLGSLEGLKLMCHCSLSQATTWMC